MADNPGDMTGPSAAASYGAPTALLVVAASIAGGVYLLRALRRRERRRARQEVANLALCLREFVERRLSASVLSAAAEAAEPGAFWAALESLASRGAGWLALSRALDGCPHFDIERAALSDESLWRRELAARRLGLLYSPASRHALRAALREGPELVSVAAAAALARYRDLDTLRWLLANPATLARRTHRARAALLRGFGRRGLTELMQALARGTGDAAMDRAVIEALGQGGHHDARMVIERRLREGDAEQRVAAARALGRLRAEDCATSLMGALQDEVWQVRAQAAWALGHSRAHVALLALPARLTDPEWWVRRHAAYALKEFGSDGRRELKRIAHGSPDPYARDMAREVLEGWPEAA